MKQDSLFTVNEAVKEIRPSKAYPYHTGVTDLKRIAEIFIPEKDIELVIP